MEHMVRQSSLKGCEVCYCLQFKLKWVIQETAFEFLWVSIVIIGWHMSKFWRPIHPYTASRTTRDFAIQVVNTSGILPSWARKLNFWVVCSFFYGRSKRLTLILGGTNFKYDTNEATFADRQYRWNNRSCSQFSFARRLIQYLDIKDE